MAQTPTTDQLGRLVELYIGYFNRAPEADGLNYWSGVLLDLLDQGQTEAQAMATIADQFYDAGIQYEVYDPNMDTDAFITLAYQNVLGRNLDNEPPENKAEALGWWGPQLEDGSLSKGQFILNLIDAAKAYADDPEWGWVPKYLEARQQAGLLFAQSELGDIADPDEAIAKGAAVLAPVSPVTFQQNPDADPAEVAQQAFDDWKAEEIGQTFTLTTGVDTPVLSANNDTITGVVSALTAENTLNTTDVIDGLEGVDTLKVDLKSNFTGFTTAGKLANVENIELTNSGTIGRNFDATGVTGAQKYVLNAGESSISLSNLAAAGIAVDVVGQKSGTVNVGFTTKAVEGTADALTLGVNGVGTAEVKDASGTVTSAAKYVTVTATGIENLTVNATGANLVNLANAATKTITAAGEGSLNVEAVGSITSFDASGVKGAVTANLTGAAPGTLATVKGGKGNDVFTVALGDLTATAAISGGAGTNTLKVSGSGTVQPTMSQFQTLELNGVDGPTIVSGKNISDLATLAIKGDGIGANTVTVAGLNTAALTVQTEGAQGGTIQLTSPTVLTYNTTSTAANTTAKTQQTVTTAITANEATNATINVGAYTKQTGDITVNKATAVILNVASGKDANGTERTAFDANLTANAAQSLIVKADGVVGSSGSNKKIVAGAATLLDVNAAAGGEMIFETVKAQQVNITAGAALDITGSKFDAAEQVTIAANVGHTNGSDVNLGKISTLNLSGTGTATGKEAQVTLRHLGAADITNAITVTATGLKGGATVGNIDTKGGNVTLNATEMTGHFKTGDIGSGANKVGNVTVNAASLGSTEIGAINTVAGATVQINATGLLGKSAADQSLKVGAVTVTSESSKNTGAISVTVDGSNAFDIGALTAKTVTVDASNFLGTAIGDAVGANKGKIGTITGQTVTVKGTELGTNKFTIDAQKDAAETTAAVSVTGGLKDDVLIISNTSPFVNTEAYTISFNGGDGTADEIVFAGTVSDLTNAGSKLTLTNVEKLTATKAVTVKAADVTGLTLTVTPTETFTVKGTDAADTIDLSKITGALTVQGGKGADTIKLKADNATVDTVKFEAAADNGTDTITGFTAGAGGDVLDFSAIAGVTGLSDTTDPVEATAAATAGTPVDLAGKVTVISNQGATVNTIEKVQALVTDAGTTAGQWKLDDGAKAIVLYGNAANGPQTFDVYYVVGGDGATDTWTKIGVVGVNDGDALVAANFVLASS